jgi:hypothetical protein
VYKCRSISCVIRGFDGFSPPFLSLLIYLINSQNLKINGLDLFELLPPTIIGNRCTVAANARLICALVVRFVMSDCQRDS